MKEKNDKTIVVLGAGMVGRAIIYDLSKDYDVVVFDKSKNVLEKLDIKRKFTESIFDKKDILDSVDTVVSALPGSISFETIKKLIMKGKNVVDISFMPQDPFDLEQLAKENNVIFIPDAGFAPGLSNIFAGYLYKNVRNIESIEIYVGGLPEKKVPPLDYAITWNVEGLIDEYTRPARYIRDGEVFTMDPLDKIEPFCISNIGAFETFYSDGLRTLLKTLKIKNMFEKTIRYAGHLEKMKLLRDLGYLSQENINECIPRKITENLFEKMKTKVTDISILLVKGIGEINIDLYVYDKQEMDDITSMGKMTGFTAAIITRMLDMIDYHGVYPPEFIGFEKNLFEHLKEELKRRKINVIESQLSK